MIEKTVAELSVALASGDISSVELTQVYLDRIARFNADLNAFITVCDESAMDQARAADAARANGETGALLGIPMAHKDIFCTQGISTTCGSRILQNFVSPYDATVVEHFKTAGAVTLGKTNMDEFAMGSSNETVSLARLKIPGTATECLEVHPGVRQQQSPPVCVRWPPAPTPEALSDSQRHSVALPGSNPVMAESHAGA
jgi:aspartyl-tRNA(Asn)/glutamyl-tRNA(Gln) amidotransferase subunit A